MGQSIESRRPPPRNIPGVSPALRRRLQRAFRALSIVSPPLASRAALELFLTPPRRRLDAVDLPVLARARRDVVPLPEGVARAGESAVRIYEWGEPQRPAVILMHGWGSHAARFGSFVDPLLAAGFRAVGIDAPAHGESPGRRSDLLQFRDALAAVARARAPVHGVIAHSLGAGAAVWLHAESEALASRPLAIFGMPRDVGYMMESFELTLALSPRVSRGLRRAFEKRFAQQPERFSAHALADRLRAPTLVVHDEDDDVAPIAHAQEFVARLPCGELFVTRGLNHSGALRDPATVRAVIDFLARSQGIP